MKRNIDGRSSSFMNIPVIVSGLIFAMLVFIAAELYVIARELSRVITLILKERENHEGKSSGQTINVNVAPTGSGTQNSTSSTISSLGIHADTKIAEDSESTINNETAVASTKPDPPKPSSSGALVIKCTRCKAENSSYRHECFNCGERL